MATEDSWYESLQRGDTVRLVIAADYEQSFDNSIARLARLEALMARGNNLVALCYALYCRLRTGWLALGNRELTVPCFWPRSPGPILRESTSNPCRRPLLKSVTGADASCQLAVIPIYCAPPETGLSGHFLDSTQ